MGHLIWEESLGAFLLVTVALGGGTAWMTGRAVALGWDEKWKMVAYVALLGCAARFIHFALFAGTLLSAHYYVVDMILLLTIAFVANVVTRAGQMSGQYGFAYTRTSPFGWKTKE
ncbi:MAG: DUF6867 family protein [Deltaproteobacteria bacterium]